VAERAAAERQRSGLAAVQQQRRGHHAALRGRVAATRTQLAALDAERLRLRRQRDVSDTISVPETTMIWCLVRRRGRPRAAGGTGCRAPAAAAAARRE